ncbi:MAG TPA: hypothetical protein VKS24_23640 [Bradyrhizobium sp.]|nr:hypothetical protein [Bradyrhizobium sp.]
MRYSESPNLAEAHDLDGISDQRIPGRPARSSIHSPRASSFGAERVVADRPSVGRRMFRAITRFLIAVLIGVGGTLTWQSRGDAVNDAARQIVVARAPMLAWLLSVSAAAPAAAATPADPVQQLAPLASSLDALRRSVELLAARQDQMAQNMAKLQGIEEDIRQTMSSPAQSQQAVAIPQHKPPQPRAQSPAAQPPSVPSPPPAATPLVLTR